MCEWAETLRSLRRPEESNMDAVRCQPAAELPVLDSLDKHRSETET
jgi:hypothetical protein